jgi:tetratricopeptide (TPR) repeat protein
MLATGRPREAIDALEAYAAVVPGSADAHHWMALAWLRLGDRRKALGEEEAALALDSNHGPAIALQAGLLFSGGDHEAGLTVLRDAVARRPSNAYLRVELADLLTDARLLADAEDEYRRVLALRPTDGRALLGLGLVLGASNRPADALEAFTRAVEASPESDEAHFARAEVLDQLGRAVEARADYAWVAQHSPRADLRRIAAERGRR